MAKQTLVDAFIQINGVTLSDHGVNVQIEDTRDQVDFTAFGATSKIYGKGLGDAKMTFTFFQDFAGGSVAATLQPLISSTTPVTVEVRPTSGARSATNQGHVMSALLFTYQPISAGVGEALQITAEFQNASSTGIQYLSA